VHTEFNCTAVLDEYGLVTTVGEQTFGKGCGQGWIRLSDGSLLILTTFLWKTPAGVCINGIGIKPDIEVGFSLAGGRDIQLEKAIEFVKENVKKFIGLDQRIPPAKLDSLRENFRKSIGL